MKKEILISSGPLETRVAILEKQQSGTSKLSDFFIDRPDRMKIVGNIYKGRVENVIPGLNSAFVNIGSGKNAYLQVDDVIPHTKKIQNVLKAGNEIMVQVTKESIGTKGPKITMDISIAGRQVVFMPFGNKVGVSKNIGQKNRRQELKDLGIKILGGKGAIFRTESEDSSGDELRNEFKYLEKLFKVVQNKYQHQKKSRLIFKDLDVVEQVIRDYFTEDVEALLTDSPEIYEDTKEYISDISPGMIEKIKLYRNRTPMFDAFNLEKEIDSLISPKVNLPSGGHIIIQEAESLCAVDVNTGKFMGANLEDTATKTNVLAAYEVARQLRLRNIGGIIVIDFIDMKHRSSQKKVLEALNDAVKNDKAKVKIYPVTNLGLIELSRSRKSPSLRSMLAETCNTCLGNGMLLSKYSVLIKVNAELSKIAPQVTHESLNIRIKLNPSVAEYFLKHMDLLCTRVQLQKDITLTPDEYQIIVD